MSVYYEMMVSHSPPVLSHSPPTTFLQDYIGKNFTSCRPQMLNSLHTRKSFPPPTSVAQKSSNPKPCLISRESKEIQVHENVVEKEKESKGKKKVVFADDRGLSLTQVRVMTEPSYVPPFWSLKFLAQITQGLVSPHPIEQWTVDFRQPASDYLQFREKVEKNYVSLENVIVKENESIIVGTVKVKNISFQKEVIVRVTWDDWKSQQDIFCTYSEIYGPSSAYVIFDTFSFKITLPPSSKKIEFCICFRSDGTEYWDNNDGNNYIISRKSVTHQTSVDALTLTGSDKNEGNSEVTRKSKPISIPQQGNKINSAITTWLDSWKQNTDTNPTPYW